MNFSTRVQDSGKLINVLEVAMKNNAVSNLFLTYLFHIESTGKQKLSYRKNCKDYDS
ncbi:MAG TPA: hypothetical protein VIJ25_03810 [Methylococcales bacterium]